jgi:cytochrome c1
MSTGHRPTFHPAVGKQVFGGITNHIVSIKDQLGQKTLKFRQFGQASQSEIYARDYKSELEEKEQEHLTEKNKDVARIASYTTAKLEKNKDAPRMLTDIPAVSADELRKKYDDADADNGDSDKDLESR